MSLKTFWGYNVRLRPTKQQQRFIAAGVAALAATGYFMLRTDGGTHVCNIAPANSTRAITAAINSCANGKIIRFPARAIYRVDDTIYVKDRHDLIVDGNGSSFTITTQGNTKQALPNGNKTGGNWLLLRGTNITLKNMTAIGSFPLAGQDRNLGKESAESGYAEYMSNFGIYGTNRAHLQDLTGKRPWGDAITTGPDTYVDGKGPPRYAQNVVISRVRAEDASRMCFALTSGRNMWLQDSYCKSGWYGGSDEELDSQEQPLSGLHILRNTWEGFNLFGIAIPVLGPTIHDIEIRGNVFLTAPDQPCNPTIFVGGVSGFGRHDRQRSDREERDSTFGDRSLGGSRYRRCDPTQQIRGIA